MSGIFVFVFSLFVMVGFCDRADDQMIEWKARNANNPPPFATDQRGCPVSSLTSVQGIDGLRGPVLLQDFNFLEHFAHAARERIPERFAHAKGYTAKGFFQLTRDVCQLSRISHCDKVGLKIPVAVRFSTSARSLGSSDMIRDNRGFAVKYYTESGNFDVVGNGFPMFPIRDALLFPSNLNRQRGNSRTGLPDPNAFWDFVANRPEGALFLMFLFSDIGTPDGYRFHNYAGVNTFKLVNANGNAVYSKFHYRSNQGIRNVSPANATKIAGMDADYSARDLYNAIENGNYPSWTVAIQVMTFQQAETYRWNPFDVTKVWLFEDFPLIPIGHIILNRNVDNHFQENEAIGFSPANLIPGIEASPDRILQARIFSYPDALRFRLGVNWQQLPVNKPIVPVNTYVRDGSGNFNNGGSGPHYFPNSFGGPVLNPAANVSTFFVAGEANRVDNGGEDNFSQALHFWENTFSDDEKIRMIDNIADSLANAHSTVQKRVIDNVFMQIHPEFGRRVQIALKARAH